MVIKRSSRWRYIIPIGVADIKREGTDVTIVSLEDHKKRIKLLRN
jgi:pyruvate/2-oxoglutarate/acetoin dehydrogenase E1 component